MKKCCKIGGSAGSVSQLIDAKKIAVEPHEREIDDCLLAAILAVGLGRGVFAKQDVICWADLEIERRSEAPTWLIGLSLANSPSSSFKELIGALVECGWNAEPTDVCVAIYSLVPDLANRSFDECHEIVKQLYEITRAAFKGDFSTPLLLEMADQFDGFDYLRACSLGDLIEGLQRFLDSKRDDAIRDRTRLGDEMAASAAESFPRQRFNEVDRPLEPAAQLTIVIDPFRLDEHPAFHGLSGHVEGFDVRFRERLVAFVGPRPPNERVLS